MNETSRELREAARSLRRAESRLPGARATGRPGAWPARRGPGARPDARRAAGAGQGRGGPRAGADRGHPRRDRRRARCSSAASRARPTRAAAWASSRSCSSRRAPTTSRPASCSCRHAMRSEGNVLGGLAEYKANLAAQRATLVAKRRQVAGMKREQERLVVKIEGLKNEAVVAKEAVEALIAEREGPSPPSSGRRRRRRRGTRGCRPSRSGCHASWPSAPGRPGSPRPGPGRPDDRPADRPTAAARCPGRCRATSPRTTGCGSTRSPGLQAARRHRLRARLRRAGARRGVGHRRPGGDVPGYGNQLVIDHGAMRGAAWRPGTPTRSIHPRAGVSASAAGEVIGYSGGASGSTAPASPPGATCTSWSTSTAARPTRWAGSAGDADGATGRADHAGPPHRPRALDSRGALRPGVRCAPPPSCAAVAVAYVGGVVTGVVGIARPAPRREPRGHRRGGRPHRVEGGAAGRSQGAGARRRRGHAQGARRPVVDLLRRRRSTRRSGRAGRPLLRGRAVAARRTGRRRRGRQRPGRAHRRARPGCVPATSSSRSASRRVGDAGVPARRGIAARPRGHRRARRRTPRRRHHDRHPDPRDVHQRRRGRSSTCAATSSRVAGRAFTRGVGREVREALEAGGRPAGPVASCSTCATTPAAC